MRIVNEAAAKKYDVFVEMRSRRDSFEQESAVGRPKIIYKKPQQGEDSPASFLTKREPELTDPLYITNKSRPMKPFLEDSTEFVQLDRWILESSAFNILKNFRFFREFYARKSFENWVAFKNYRKFCRSCAF